MSVIDKLAREFAPGLAVKRLQNKRRYDTMASSGWSGAYDAGYETRRRRFPAFKSAFERDEDREMSDYELRAMRLNVRELRRNLGLVFGCLNRFANGVVGSGLTPMPKTASKDWNNEATEWWQNYQRVCDYRDRLHGWELQRLFVKARMCEGHAGLVYVDNGQVLPIEAERIDTPPGKGEDGKVVRGFRLTPAGRPLGVYIMNRDKNGHLARDDWKYVAWENFRHVSSVERFDQMGGVPSLASVVNYFRDKGEFTLATLIKAKMDAFKGWQVKSDEDLQADNIEDREAAQTETGNGVRVEKSEMGEIWYTPANAELKSLASNTPNKEYDSFNENILREISMALDIPSEVLMLSMANTSFSGGRGILMLAYNTFDIWREWLIHKLLQPWWNWRIAKAIKDGQLAPAPLDKNGVSTWYKVNWLPPALDSVDPRGEASANKMEVELGTDSVARIAARRGTSEDELFSEKAGSIGKAIKLAAQINKENEGANVSWRDITNPSTPGAQQTTGAGTESLTEDTEDTEGTDETDGTEGN